MTQILGKDAPVEQSIAHFEEILKKLNISVTESNWMNPLEDVYSVNLSVTSCPTLYSNGKGSSRLAARASAYGELFERLATHMEFSDYYLDFRVCQIPETLAGPRQGEQHSDS